MIIRKKHSGSDLTIFSEMTALSVQNKAINLAQGFPDYEIDPLLKKYLAEGTQKNMNQYAPMVGFPELIQNLKTFNEKRKNPISVDISEIIVTPGATYAIYGVLATILQPGDEIIILEPAYDSYVPSIEVNGGKPVFVSLDENFRPNFEKIKEAVNEKTKAILVNSPHNPSGTLWSKNDWESLWEIIKDTNILVISDEVYDLLCYEKDFVSAFHHPQLRNRSFSIFSFGKMFHITGWKTGYMLASENLMQAFKRVHQYLIFCVNTPAQYALAKYLEVFDPETNRTMMLQKRDFFLREFSGLPFTFMEKAEGSYFQTASYEKISSIADKDFAVWLTCEKKVSAIPVSAFYHNLRNTGKVRFCFAKKEETIIAAAETLKNLL